MQESAQQIFRELLYLKRTRNILHPANFALLYSKHWKRLEFEIQKLYWEGFTQLSLGQLPALTYLSAKFQIQGNNKFKTSLLLSRQRWVRQPRDKLAKGANTKADTCRGNDQMTGYLQPWLPFYWKVCAGFEERLFFFCFSKTKICTI